MKSDESVKYSVKITVEQLRTMLFRANKPSPSISHINEHLFSQGRS